MTNSGVSWLWRSLYAFELDFTDANLSTTSKWFFHYMDHFVKYWHLWDTWNFVLNISGCYVVSLVFSMTSLWADVLSLCHFLGVFGHWTRLIYAQVSQIFPVGLFLLLENQKFNFEPLQLQSTSWKVDSQTEVLRFLSFHLLRSMSDRLHWSFEECLIKEEVVGDG